MSGEKKEFEVRAEFLAKEPRWEIISMEPAPFDGMPSYAQLLARVKELEAALDEAQRVALVLAEFECCCGQIHKDEPACRAIALRYGEGATARPKPATGA